MHASVSKALERASRANESSPLKRGNLKLSPPRHATHHPSFSSYAPLPPLLTVVLETSRVSLPRLSANESFHDVTAREVNSYIYFPGVGGGFRLVASLGPRRHFTYPGEWI